MHANLAAGSRYTILGRAGRSANQVGATNGWGVNDAAQLGDLSESSSGLFISAGPMPLPVAVVAGIEHSCALAADGTVRCWGSNQFGQLGTGQLAQGPFAAPQQVAGVDDAVSIASGPFHTCVVLVDGRVQCWGRNDFRQIGDGTLTDRRFATTVPGISRGRRGGADTRAHAFLCAHPVGWRALLGPQQPGPTRRHDADRSPLARVRADADGVFSDSRFSVRPRRSIRSSASSPGRRTPAPSA